MSKPTENTEHNIDDILKPFCSAEEVAEFKAKYKHSIELGADLYDISVRESAERLAKTYLGIIKRIQPYRAVGLRTLEEHNTDCHTLIDYQTAEVLCNKCRTEMVYSRKGDFWRRKVKTQQPMSLEPDEALNEHNLHTPLIIFPTAVSVQVVCPECKEKGWKWI